MKQYDAIIIGFGKGGKTLAAELAKRKLDVAVVERSEKMYGGTCINIGCIPTKTLVHAAKHADKDASWEVKKAYYRQSIARKEEVVSFLRQKNYHNLADNPHITVYTGIGSFAGPDVVEVGMVEGTLQLQAPRIFINTGAETVIPPIEGIQGNPAAGTARHCRWGIHRTRICFHVCFIRFASHGARGLFRTDIPGGPGHCGQCPGGIGTERNRFQAECTRAVRERL